MLLQSSSTTKSIRRLTVAHLAFPSSSHTSPYLAAAHLALPRRRTPYQNSNQWGGSTGPRNLERGEGLSRGGIGYVASGLGYQDGVWVGLAVGHMGEGGDAL
ncbi:hypothetical protein ACFX1W_007722 [Malus domestica]